MLTTILIVWLVLQPVALLIALMLCRAAAVGDAMREEELRAQRAEPVAAETASGQGSIEPRPSFSLPAGAVQVRRPAA